MAVNLIVCEQRGAWAAALRRQLADTVVLVETRTADECRRELIRRGPALVAVEFAGKRAAEAAALVAWVHDASPASLPVVLAERRLAGWQWRLRELGAAHVVTSPRRLVPLADMVVRLERRLPRPTSSWAQQLWATLPWGEVAAG